MKGDSLGFHGGMPACPHSCKVVRLQKYPLGPDAESFHMAIMDIEIVQHNSQVLQ